VEVVSNPDMAIFKTHHPFRCTSVCFELGKKDLISKVKEEGEHRKNSKVPVIVADRET